MKTYQIAPDEVGSLVEELIEAYHPKLKEAGVTISLLFAYDGNGNAVSCGGYPALAVVRIVSLKDRVKGNKDAEIVIDAEKFEELDEAQQRALLDHELHHLDTVPDESDGVKRDRAGRPKLAMRKHDLQIGWFKIIADRHGEASPERMQARQIFDKYGQSFFPFLEQKLA